MAAPVYTYYPAVPQGPSGMNVTQPHILSNFQSFAELFAVNHEIFASNYAGKHSVLLLETQSDDPETGEDDVTLYVKETPSGTNSHEIFYRYPNNGTVEQLIGSEGTTSATSSITSDTVGYVTFPSGLTLFWGNGSITPNGWIEPVDSPEYPYYPYEYYGTFTISSNLISGQYLSYFMTTLSNGGIGEIAIPYNNINNYSVQVVQMNSGTTNFLVFNMVMQASNIISLTL